MLFRSENFLDLFKSATMKLSVGDPSLETTDVGTMINLSAAERVEKMVADSVKSGAEEIIPFKREGAVVYPTILMTDNLDVEVVAEEIFGPIAVVIPSENLDEAISIANSSVFGLQSSCFTSSLETAFRVSEELDVGSLWINEGSRFRMDNTPFGGVGDSGYGREGVKYAMEELSYLKFTGIRFPGRK